MHAPLLPASKEQFVNVYGNRFLFLCPPNEYDVPKFLPTTIRPTHLPYKELYEHQSCAQFLADFFSYDELSPPDRYPSKIPAPASVLKWQAGDCFDISVAMVSLLVGVGYDAYCVSGFAPRFITTRNEAAGWRRGRGSRRRDSTTPSWSCSSSSCVSSTFVCHCLLLASCVFPLSLSLSVWSGISMCTCEQGHVKRGVFLLSPARGYLLPCFFCCFLPTFDHAPLRPY
ncbi:unnamed protein product [Prorocentrum cordatum]|uniref:Transglutaminase-like domain-containing protein n=1 Tax=Prorocentrum cordatum TaxID=2364126 RepID=A0ABN9S881_9DINO|nr:unnamed protein product [Polarella glacialis]